MGVKVRKPELKGLNKAPWYKQAWELSQFMPDPTGIVMSLPKIGAGYARAVPKFLPAEERIRQGALQLGEREGTGHYFPGLTHFFQNVGDETSKLLAKAYAIKPGVTEHTGGITRLLPPAKMKRMIEEGRNFKRFVGGENPNPHVVTGEYSGDIFDLISKNPRDINKLKEVMGADQIRYLDSVLQMRDPIAQYKHLSGLYRLNPRMFGDAGFKGLSHWHEVPGANKAVRALAFGNPSGVQGAKAFDMYDQPLEMTLRGLGLIP